MKNIIFIELVVIFKYINKISSYSNTKDYGLTTKGEG